MAFGDLTTLKLAVLIYLHLTSDVSEKTLKSFFQQNKQVTGLQFSIKSFYHFI